MRVSAVIGSNFGDEGKGHVVDYLSTKKSLVVRFNGGAQAGHTVVEWDDRRHVFHHFGSGALAGASTFLGEDFLVNPIEFHREYEELASLEVYPRTYIDPEARVTTPWDMILNQAAELSRGQGRHGSCGLGIHETVHRSEQEQFRLHMKDLWQTNTTQEKLQMIWDHWVPQRLEELKLSKGVFLEKWGKLKEGIHDHFEQDLEFLWKRAFCYHWQGVEKERYENIIFEGAQGLRLDQDAPGFPHVTCSKTGLDNVVKMMRQLNLTSELEIFYVTRPYITRHGAGPLSHELERTPLVESLWGSKEKTNVANQWQGPFRYGIFDMAEFLGPVLKDFYDARVSAVPKLFLTCVDHIEKYVEWHDDGAWKSMPVTSFATELLRRTEFESLWFSSGPTRDDITGL